MKDPEITRLNRKQDATISDFISVIYLLKSIRRIRLKIKMLNQRSLTQKSTQCMIPFIRSKKQEKLTLVK